MRPGATSTQLRWRVGSWLVGAGIFAVLALALLGGSLGLLSLAVLMAALGTLVANPFTMARRLRSHSIGEPIVRLRPLGVFGFVVFLIAFLVPFAIGEWLLNAIAERFEDSSGPTKPPTDDDTWHDQPLDPIFIQEPRRRSRIGRILRPR